jgi:hypothetical protein
MIVNIAKNPVKPGIEGLESLEKTGGPREIGELVSPRIQSLPLLLLIAYGFRAGRKLRPVQEKNKRPLAGSSVDSSTIA